MTQVSGNGHKRAILYARVSTDDQADKGYSLLSQLDLTRKYAERIGYEIVTELTEDYSGATPIAERPTGRQLVAMLKARQADAIVVYQVDRLSRDIVNLLATVQMWLRAGVEVHTCDIGKIESELDIVLVIKGWQGSDERKKIRERCMRGKRAKAQAGKVVCTRAPYGYLLGRDSNNRIATLDIVEDMARIIRLIFQWYVDGDENGKPLSQEKITDRLNAMHAPTPGKRKKSNSGEWNRQAVQYILSNEVYAGVYRYGVLIGNTNTKRPLGEAVTMNVPLIIDRETWERAQARKQYNKAMALRNTKYDYLLRGLLRCGCGGHMSGLSKQGKRFYYMCDGARNVVAKRQCQEQVIRAEILERQIWEGLERRTRDIEKLTSDLYAAQQEELDSSEPKRAELQAIEVLIEQADQEANEIATALRKATGRVGDKLQAQQDEVNARIDALIERRAKLQAELGARLLTDDAIGDIVQFARDVREGIKNADFDAKRRMLETLGVKITIKAGRFYAKCLLGEWEGEILSLRAYRALPSMVDAGLPLGSCRCRPSATRRGTLLIWVP